MKRFEREDLVWIGIAVAVGMLGILAAVRLMATLPTP